MDTVSHHKEGGMSWIKKKTALALAAPSSIVVKAVVREPTNYSPVSNNNNKTFCSLALPL